MKKSTFTAADKHLLELRSCRDKFQAAIDKNNRALD
jgi:hypothetical protein